MRQAALSIIGALLISVALGACADAAPPDPGGLPSASSVEPSVDPIPSSSSASPSPTPTPTPSASVTAEPPADAPPGQVEGLTAERGGGSGEVVLRWRQNPEADVVSYIVLRATLPDGPLTQIGTVTPQDVTEFEFAPFVDSVAAVGYYRVRAVDAAGQAGPASAAVCGASIGNSC